MDIPEECAYPLAMLARIVAMFAIFAITAVTTVAPAHAARVGVTPPPAHMMPASEVVSEPAIALACQDQQQCGTAEAAMCEFVCTGVPAFLAAPDEKADHQPGSMIHDLAHGQLYANWMPGLNERPPKFRLI